NVEIFDDDNEIVNFDVQGEIRIKGDNVFLEYWNKPQYTKDSFYNGWFKTGDIAIRNDRGVYKILGRSSVDIIKSGGYKISAIEIEEILREFPGIKECAVVGIEDKTWGEKIGAVVVLKSDNIFNINQLREWAKDKIANYKLPTLLRVENSLPRNVMGKVDKIKVKELFK
nr:AMP-binding protein [Candidatus Dadabacteria bacterium]NIQ16321.1 AMP-binding protein [Candidatus Dadabacteria bacterium]